MRPDAVSIISMTRTPSSLSLVTSSSSLAEMAAALMEPGLVLDMDKLSYEIFSILESKFLFGYDSASSPMTPASAARTPGGGGGWKVRILSIEGGGGGADGILAAVALSHLESLLQKKSGDPSARIADFFDVAAGSASGGVIAAMLFTRGPDGRPLFSAEDALKYTVDHRRKHSDVARRGLGFIRGLFRRGAGGAGRLRRVFAGATLRDTVKPVLIPCYDLSTGAPFLFSRADAVESEAYDFTVREICAATCADVGAVEMRSTDGSTRIAAVGGGVAMGNPTAAAITHVLNNKQEFPHAFGLDDLLVLSLGGGATAAACGGARSTPSPAELVRIAGDGVADMVDQAVAMAFGHSRNSNYVRIQANGLGLSGSRTPRSGKSDARKAAEEVLEERNVESVMFRGKKISEKSNAEKLEWFSGELVKEEERRKQSAVAMVVIRQVVTSSATALTAMTATTTAAAGASSSP